MPNKDKILICGILPPPFFGHSMMYKMLMESEFVRAHDVVFLNMSFWSYEKHRKITVDKIFKMTRYLVRYIRLLVRHRPRYVLFNMSFDKMPFLKDYLFCLIGRLFGARIVLHDMGQYLPELYHGSGPVLRTLIRHLLGFTTAIIVMGQKVKAQYAPFFDLKRIQVVPGSVEDTVDISISKLPRADPKEIKVLYFSFLSRSKGIWTALKAIPKVVAENKDIFFQFGGPIESEALHEQMKAFIADNHLSANLEYIGYVGDVNKRTECYRNADIFIFPTHRDVFGLVILHAMAESVPVIASIEGTIPEIIADGTNGLLFPKADANALAEKILALVADADLRRKMGGANRRRYLDVYAPDKYGKAMIRAFEEIHARS